MLSWKENGGKETRTQAEQKTKSNCSISRAMLKRVFFFGSLRLWVYDITLARLCSHSENRLCSIQLMTKKRNFSRSLAARLHCEWKTRSKNAACVVNGICQWWCRWFRLSLCLFWLCSFVFYTISPSHNTKLKVITYGHISNAVIIQFHQPYVTVDEKYRQVFVRSSVL